MSNWLDFETYDVWGMGVSGIAAANLLARHGKSVVLSDPKDEFAVEGVDERVQLHFGSNHLSDGVQVVVVSPGLKPSLPVFDTVPDGVHIVSDVDLAFDATETPFIAITGTDGKTTTTSLIEHILNSSDVKTLAAGNIGIPLCDVVELDFDVIVAELSAFQLWSCHHFRAQINVFTNIAGDHLDYFETFEEYIEAKHRMVAFCNSDDIGIFNADDDVIAGWTADFEGQALTYGAASTTSTHANVTRDGIEFDGLQLALKETKLRGRHNALNLACAVMACRSFGVESHDIRTAAMSFEPLPDRIEPVRTVDGIEYVNDSKATNAHAAIAGINAIDGPLVVITGGVDKGLDLDGFVQVLAHRADALVVIGDLRDRLGAALNAKNLDVTLADSMDEAVRVAAEKAKPGSTVLLSPAASSFDMFASYKDRGKAFKKAVQAL